MLTFELKRGERDALALDAGPDTIFHVVTAATDTRMLASPSERENIGPDEIGFTRIHCLRPP